MGVFHQPVRVGALEFTETLREKGYTVILKTSRPIHEHPHLIKWTYDWVHEHGFTFDEVLFNRYYVASIIQRYPTLEFIVDDDPKIVTELRDLGLETFLFTGDFDEILENLDEGNN